MMTVSGFSWMTSAIFGVGLQFFLQSVTYLIMYQHAKFQRSVADGSVILIFSGEGAYVAVLHKLRVNFKMQ